MMEGGIIHHASQKANDVVRSNKREHTRDILHTFKHYTLAHHNRPIYRRLLCNTMALKSHQDFGNNYSEGRNLGSFQGYECENVVFVYPIFDMFHRN